MRIRLSSLRRIIKEEVSKTLNESDEMSDLDDLRYALENYADGSAPGVGPVVAVVKNLISLGVFVSYSEIENFVLKHLDDMFALEASDPSVQKLLSSLSKMKFPRRG